MLDYNNIGQTCKEYRIRMGYSQKTVAIDTGYTQSNVVSFEQGNNNNARIFLWYIKKGLLRYLEVTHKDDRY